MKKKNSARRLVLNKETISALNPLEMHAVHGGEQAVCPPPTATKCEELYFITKPGTDTCGG
jgi:hypothetical protein